MPRVISENWLQLVIFAFLGVGAGFGGGQFVDHRPDPWTRTQALDHGDKIQKEMEVWVSDRLSQYARKEDVPPDKVMIPLTQVQANQVEIKQDIKELKELVIDVVHKVDMHMHRSKPLYRSKQPAIDLDDFED